MEAKRCIAVGILSLFLVTGSGNAFAAPSGTIGQGNISVYKGGRLADKFTGQNPVEDEALLVCDGKCMIKATGISLVGTGGAKLAIKRDQELFNLLVNEGRVDFIITDSISKVAFYTHDGQYTVADIMFNASTNTPVRGYMQVAEDGTSEIGVTEGRMIFSTTDGAKTVDSNNRMMLAQVPAAGAVAGAAGGSAAAVGGGGGTLLLGTAGLAGLTLAGGLIAEGAGDSTLPPGLRGTQAPRTASGNQ